MGDTQAFRTRRLNQTPAVKTSILIRFSSLLRNNWHWLYAAIRRFSNENVSPQIPQIYDYQNLCILFVTGLRCVAMLANL